MLKNMKISAKMLLGFMSVIIFTALIGVVSLVNMVKITESSEIMYKRAFAVSSATLKLTNDITRIHREMKDIASATNNFAIKESQQKIDALENDVYDQFNIIFARFIGDKSIVDTPFNDFKNWKPIRDEVIKLTLEGKKQEALEITKGEGKGAMQAALIGNEIKKLTDLAEEKAVEFYDKANSSAAQAQKLVIVLLAFCMVLAVIIALIITKNITGPMAALVYAARAVARGDLTGNVDLGVKRKDEIGVLASAFANMVDNLKTMIMDIQKISLRLSSHSQELASSSEEVSATVEEVASTTNEVAAISAQGAENAEAAAAESKQVRVVGEYGNRAVRETVEKINSIAVSSGNASNAIQKLGQQSGQIGEIISTITTIAEQTNLLALNAAIEAARAGDHGRGFAVVAEEVRKLAEQSAKAANEITGLIREIQTGVGEAVNVMTQGVDEVKEGVRIAANAGSALEQIVKAVEKNKSMIIEVAAGSRQANEATQQLTTAYCQITSTVQQVSGAAQELANISAELQSTVGRFMVEAETESD